ncbi:DUF5340 domain-containing protein [Desertifilum sp. FACHB-1129]|uniref:DUF5340 domain-containing protein n=2 Tax=Desertifilum tharense IPPAS B-1220 TaxID=1781255 RepID=A0A1E5QFY1_9CYAN|nr:MULTISPECIES: DUF5340 domain-containing protein [Desertifilum]MDA0211607.1 DUF5340 domain-containing protein [Cyanobacteria bacterium FC1]MDI9639156.1 DUF5340 domain-containing protein [Geitlerinema splendidum]MBD2310131.1 DUF5340 domain-containing protein [Desertifilum sp. FACHB-1129]MBD2322065.1 DUF5340 domain-containing protein [Desertifilum sp. FACHB-866]MBD2333856.1 DUF5340 domain-containing protein [Desertifilum sp. FACHB-868]
MEPIPLPSHIHYELLLQLLERQTWFAVSQKSPQQEQVHQLIITLRKALAQQRQLEASCQRANLPIEYRWSINEPPTDRKTTSEDESTAPPPKATSE